MSRSRGSNKRNDSVSLAVKRGRHLPYVSWVPFRFFFALLLSVSHYHYTQAYSPRSQAGSTMRYSGLQREVLKLYRQCLRAAGQKPEVRRATG